MVVQRYALFVSVVLIFSLGLVMVFDTSSAEILDRDLAKHTHQDLLRQIFYAFFGIGVALVAWFIGYENLLKMSTPIFFFFSFLLLLVFIPGIGKTFNGARRWVGVGGYTIQPSEYIKFVVPLFYISYFLNNEKVKDHFPSFVKLMSLISVPIILIFFEPDTGTAGIVGIIVMMLLVVTRVKMKFWATPVLCMALIAGVLAYNLPYVKGRIAVYLNPELDILGKGHQPFQAKIAAGSGGLFGRGIGQSLQKLSYLPEAQNDYIAAIFAEEFGFIGMLVLITLYMVVGYLGFCIAFFAKDRGGAYLAFSITFLICIQAFLNLGVVSGMLPSTGLNLPFFSQGGTSLMANIVGISILLNVAARSEERKRGHLKKEIRESFYE